MFPFATATSGGIYASSGWPKLTKHMPCTTVVGKIDVTGHAGKAAILNCCLWLSTVATQSTSW
jgi:hypothetical protein